MDQVDLSRVRVQAAMNSYAGHHFVALLAVTTFCFSIATSALGGGKEGAWIMTGPGAPCSLYRAAGPTGTRITSISVAGKAPEWFLLWAVHEQQPGVDSIWHARVVLTPDLRVQLQEPSRLGASAGYGFNTARCKEGICVTWVDPSRRIRWRRLPAGSEGILPVSNRSIGGATFFPDHDIAFCLFAAPFRTDATSMPASPGSTASPVEIFSAIHATSHSIEAWYTRGSTPGQEPPVRIMHDPPEGELREVRVFSGGNDCFDLFVDVSRGTDDGDERHFVSYDARTGRSERQSVWRTGASSTKFSVYEVPGVRRYFLIWDEEAPSESMRIHWTTAVPGERASPVKMLSDDEYPFVVGPIPVAFLYGQGDPRGVAAWTVVTSISADCKRRLMISRFGDGRWARPLALDIAATVEAAVVNEDGSGCLFLCNDNEVLGVAFQIRW